MELQQLREDHALMAEHLSQLSEALLGYRGGDFSDMIKTAISLKLKAQNVEVDNNFRQLADAISDLKQMTDDIMSDA